MALRIEEEYRVKRARGTKNYGVSNSPYHYKSNQTKSTRASKNSKKVFIKMYSGCSTKGGLSKHVDYIVGKDLEAVTSDGLTIVDKNDLALAKERMLLENPDLEKGSKFIETYNLTFSLRGYDLSSHSENDFNKLLREAVLETVRKKYPNNYFIAALHTDTAHPHMHICLGKIDAEKNKKINLAIKDLRELKHEFSKQLIERKINVEPEKKSFQKVIDQYKTNDFEFISSGTASYNFIEGERESFYLQYKTNRDQKIVTLWGKNLQKAVEENALNAGDRIKLKKSKHNTKYEPAIWSIDVLERAKEKDTQDKKLTTLFSQESKEKIITKVENENEKDKIKALFTDKEKELIKSKTHNKDIDVIK